jgi:sec-independent protein translocase protein TatA
VGNIGPLEILVVLIIALIVLGPQRLPGAARTVGRGVREFREAISGVVGGDDDEERAEIEEPEPPKTARPREG